MKRLIIFAGIFVPMYVSAQNIIFNPGFDMVPWDTGWVDTVVGFYCVKADTTSFLSPPNSCCLWAWGGGGSCYYWAKTTQTIYPPATNCTCRVFFEIRHRLMEWKRRSAD